MPRRWSNKYKRSIDCKHPKGFSQRAHCRSRLKSKSRRRRRFRAAGKRTARDQPEGSDHVDQSPRTQTHPSPSHRPDEALMNRVIGNVIQHSGMPNTPDLTNHIRKYIQLILDSVRPERQDKTLKEMLHMPELVLADLMHNPS